MIRTQKILTVPVKYVRNDSITPFSSIDCTRAVTIMPGTRRSIEIPLRSFVCIRAKPKKKMLIIEENGGRQLRQPDNKTNKIRRNIQHISTLYLDQNSGKPLYEFYQCF